VLPAFAFTLALAAVDDRPADALALWRDVNAVRAAAGLAPLALEPQLCDVARAHARDMATRNYFDHESPEGVGPFDRLARAGWHYGYAGENIALDADEGRVESDLYASPGHRANMLGPHYRRVGIAAVRTPAGEIFVEDFSD
jgi:uncharacterized protein YkwD